MIRRLLIAHGNFFFRHRNAIFPLFILAAVLLAQPCYPGGSRFANDLTDLLGLAIALAGQSLRIVTIGYRYIVRGGRHGNVYANDLVTDGVFAHCRNPMYVGNLLIFLSLAVVANAPWLYVAGLPFFVYVYVAIVAAEESYLRGRFGEGYEAYCRDVPRWGLRLRGVRETVRGQPFQAGRVLLKEYGTITALAGGLLITRAWSVYRVEGRDALPEIRAWAWAALPLAVFYVVAFWLKKSHRMKKAGGSTRVSTEKPASSEQE